VAEGFAVYGVPANLDLAFLHDAELIQICLGQYQLQFHFHPTGYISVEGGWELRDVTAAVIDHGYDVPDRPPYQLHRLLHKRVLQTKVFAPEWFELQFDGGYVLRVFDDSQQYESFQIEPGGIIV
jgi:hypothetical protein